MFAITASAVTKQFPSRGAAAPVAAVDNITLRVEAGKIHGLLGPNGAGKSTLISMISGALQPTSGSIEVFGIDIQKELVRAKQTMGVVPQELAVEMAFTVEEVLFYISGMYGVPRRGRKDLIKTVLEDLQLSDKAQERARTLSGGMKRRLMIAKALLHKPKLLILDEPTAGVDVALRQKIWELVRRLHAEGTTILFTTHYLEEAEQLCEDITLINKGVIVKQGKLRDIQKEFSKNVIHFELFDNAVEHLSDVRKIGVEFAYPMTDLATDMEKLTRHYHHNLKSIRSEAASLEHVFLELTK